MSQLDDNGTVPPVGEEIHMPAPSILPLINAAGLALYRKVGFEVEGRRVRHYRRRNGELWDAMLMALVLDDFSPGSPHPDAERLTGETQG